MWNKIQYALIYSWVKVHALLPMWALYILSDILYVLVYKVVRYRVKVVRQNMKASFPDKSDTELRRLEREFYHHFADYVVETIKLAHISLEELQRRAFLKNPELVDTLMEKGHTCFILLMGHYGNWEWFSGSTSRFKDSRIYQIYRPLNNQAFDRLFLTCVQNSVPLGSKTGHRARCHHPEERQNPLCRDLYRRPDTEPEQPALLDELPEPRFLHPDRPRTPCPQTGFAGHIPRHEAGETRLLYHRYETGDRDSQRDS